jgi:Kef-type K+ transport system membrane component KefB
VSALEVFQSLPGMGRFAVIFGLIVILPKLSERAGLPGVFGLLVGGILLGPNLLGLVNPQNKTIQLFSELGKLMLMFFAGFEINLNQIKKEGTRTIAFGLLTFTVPMLVGTAVGLAFGFTINASILIGSLMASHTLLGLPVVKDLALMNNNAVLMAVGATIVTDILAMLVLAICIMVHVSGFSPEHIATNLIELAIFVPLVVFGLSWLARKLLALFTSHELRLGILLLVICITATLAHAIELEGIVGAFLAGIAVNRAVGEDRSPAHELEVVSQALFIPVFFLSTGFLVDFKIFISTLLNHTSMVIAVVGGLLTAKFIAAWLAKLFSPINKTEMHLMWSLTTPQVAATLAATMVAYATTNAAGERLLNEAMLNSVVVLVVVTSVLGPVLTKHFGRQVRAD